MINQKRRRRDIILIIIIFVNELNWNHGGSHCVLLLNDKALPDIDIDALLALLQSFHFRWLVTDGRRSNLAFNKITLDLIILSLLLQNLLVKLDVLVVSHSFITIFTLRLAVLLHVHWWRGALLAFLATEAFLKLDILLLLHFFILLNFNYSIMLVSIHPVVNSIARWALWFTIYYQFWQLLLDSVSILVWRPFWFG